MLMKEVMFSCRNAIIVFTLPILCIIFGPKDTEFLDILEKVAVYLDLVFDFMLMQYCIVRKWRVY